MVLGQGGHLVLSRISMASTLVSPGVAGCASCGGPLERIEQYVLDIAGAEVLFFADRCGSCGNEYVNAPEVLRGDAEVLTEFQPAASPFGAYRKLMSLLSQDPDYRNQPGPKVAATILAYLLRQDLADVVFLVHQGVSEEPVVAFDPGGLLRAGETRMGPGRAVVTGSGLRANLLTLAQLRNFVGQDRGRHPRIAVMGRPCQIYTVQKLRWDRFAPGYELTLALGTYCYGNFTPAAWGARKLRSLLGFDPAEIRRVESAQKGLRFVSADGAHVIVDQAEISGLVNANCLQCYDFSASFSDVSVGLAGPEDLFESVVVRTGRGEQVVNRAIRDGILTTAARVYGRTDPTEDERKTENFLRAMVETKRQITRKLW